MLVWRDNVRRQVRDSVEAGSKVFEAIVRIVSCGGVVFDIGALLLSDK